jgi:DNA polymerase-1
MEKAGVKVDRDKLALLSEEYAVRLEELERRMFDLAEGEFNPRSPKNLAEILFDKLKLPVIRKTATGRSTDAAVLEELSLSHPLPAVVLEHRSFSKLKNSFIDTLPKLVDPADGRIHADFNQTITATGRLSSANPNLQNIPVRGDQGRRIREAFVAEPGFKLVSADYSQIELRVMAHMSNDKVLLELFASGRDIHSETASRLFNIGPLGVNSEMRRQAKTVNFGILYGISPFGLARQLGVDRAQAKQMIETYFASFPGVRHYIDQLIKDVHDTGVCRTLFGRIRQIPDINASNRQRREAAERLAVNTPIQGSAADLIKRAMLDALEAARREKIEGRLILQVHDELIFEVREDQAELARDLICEAMRNAAKLNVELKAESGIGSDWYSAHGG